ncbi:MAG: 23S rRNA (adenine1618-N6)-methyltransferase [Verrucomicrobiales bacterium]|jgi:23S rRNA (adenine1618-N6)-methyltransferase
MTKQPHNKKSAPGQLHPSNPHAGRYDFAALTQACPELNPFLRANPVGDQTIDFADPKAVQCLNRALLSHHYQITNWQIPPGYLCPPIPGRADYIHHLADLLSKTTTSKAETTRGLDIGTGANCVYPIIGHQSYGWQFVGSDIDPIAVANAKQNIAANPALSDAVEIVHQKQAKSIFSGIITAGDHFDFTMSNPPFYTSAAEASSANERKVKNLGKATTTAARNFGGSGQELWCPGGELKFVSTMIQESATFASQVTWFTSLVSKHDHLAPLKRNLTNTEATQVKVIEMTQGHKRSRFIAWRF